MLSSQQMDALFLGLQVNFLGIIFHCISLLSTSRFRARNRFVNCLESLFGLLVSFLFAQLIRQPPLTVQCVCKRLVRSPGSSPADCK